jgi:hypothetical protein
MWTVLFIIILVVIIAGYFLLFRKKDELNKLRKIKLNMNMKFLVNNMNKKNNFFYNKVLNLNKLYNKRELLK